MPMPKALLPINYFESIQLYNIYIRELYTLGYAILL